MSHLFVSGRSGASSSKIGKKDIVLFSYISRMERYKGQLDRCSVEHTKTVARCIDIVVAASVYERIRSCLLD